MEYQTDHAELYDLVFRSRGKDFAAEAAELTRRIRELRPQARSLLDVACGTGAHLESFAAEFDKVAGVEIAPAMRAVARRRLPDIPVLDGDMRSFDAGSTFDAVICLGNAVACMLSESDLDAAVARMAGHLVPGGVLVVEPWWFPESFIDGYVGGHLVRTEGQVVSRVTRSVREGSTTVMQIKFVVATAGELKEWTDVLVTSLFTRERYEAAFTRAGCSVEFVEQGLRLADGRWNAPGLFVGVRT